jgi:hypothetical protein
MTTKKFPKATPHDPIKEIFPDLFVVYGSVRLPPPGMRISRNMVIVRQGDELTLISPVRLSKKGEKALETLGVVKNVIRLAYGHGLDDHYYVERYGAAFWSQPGPQKYDEPKADYMLAQGSGSPVGESELFVFKETKFPESALLLRRHGGVLITCDSVQHWSNWNQCTIPARFVMKYALGFSKTTLIGPVWLKAMTPKGGSLRPDFDRLLALQFDHLIAAHGSFCKGGAHERVETAILRAFS